jgi:hypothetical protein
MNPYPFASLNHFTVPVAMRLPKKIKNPDPSACAKAIPNAKESRQGDENGRRAAPS